MFRALLCSSSGGSIVYVQQLLQSLSASGRTLHWLREFCLNQCNVRPLTESDGTLHWLREFCLNQCNVRPLTESDVTRCCTYTIEPPEDEHNNARNMYRIVILYE